MSEISSLEHRIAQALERIRGGIDALPSPSAAKAEVDTLTARVAELEAALSAAQSEAEAARGRAAEIEGERNELEDAVKHLQSVNADLRASAADAVGNPEAINRALVSDLEALQAARSTDLRDIDALLAELAPYAKGA